VPDADILGKVIQELVISGMSRPMGVMGLDAD
jgi:hypothetical protein